TPIANGPRFGGARSSRCSAGPTPPTPRTPRAPRPSPSTSSSGAAAGAAHGVGRLVDPVERIRGRHELVQLQSPVLVECDQAGDVVGRPGGAHLRPHDPYAVVRQARGVAARLLAACRHPDDLERPAAPKE